MGLFCLNFLRTGYYQQVNGIIYYFTESGHWWSNAAITSQNGYNLGSAAAGIILQNNNPRGFGFAIRCVVREGRKSKGYILTIQNLDLFVVGITTGCILLMD